jgi:hypothetical protein
MIDKDLNVIGLVFDGNIEMLANNYVFDDEVSRTVSVHPAIIIESLRKIYGASALADELERKAKGSSKDQRVGAPDEARQGKAQADVNMLAGAVRMYYVKNSQLPESLQDLVQKDEKGRSHIMELPTDPWGADYVLVPGKTPREFYIVSGGSDKKVGTDDDVSSRPRK